MVKQSIMQMEADNTLEINTQIILLWITVAFYVASSVAFAWELVRGHLSIRGNIHQAAGLQNGKDKKAAEEKDFRWGVGLAFWGLFPHAAALFLRWMETGHGPYMRRFEVYSSDVWVAVLVYMLIQWRKPILRFTGVLIMPSSFLLIGMAVLASPEIRPLPPFYGTYWLIVHIFFAKLAYVFLLIGTSLAFFYLIKNKVESKTENKPEVKEKPSALISFMARFPDLPTLHEQSYQFIAFGFIMLAIMIAAGAIWAHKAWGRYWSWDPVETWSIITWLLYGIYLHLVRTYGWSGRRPAWLAVAAVFVMIFALFGVGLVYDSLHSPYMG